MSNETQYLQKIQAAYASQNADAQRTLRSMLFEFEPVLQRFTALKQEADRALAASAELDVSVIVERFRPALEVASQLAVDFDTVDDALRALPSVAGLIFTAEARLTLASAAAYREKFATLVAGAAVPTAADATLAEPPAPAPTAPLDPAAQAFAEGEDHFFGDNGKKQDFVQAAVIFHRLAEHKHPRALKRLAYLYSTGKGVKQDYATQLDLLRKAADLGDGEAMADLSAWYRVGHEPSNLPQSFDQALFWAKRALDAGERQAHYKLGQLYADEKYPGHNSVVALGHFQEGSRIGCSIASAELGNVYRYGK